MEQAELASIISKNFNPISVSTVSRILNQMAELHYCDFIEELSQYGRKRQKYFMTGSFKDLVINRIKYNIDMFSGILNFLEKVNTDIPKEEREENADLLELISNLTMVYGLSIKLYEQFAKMTEKEFKNL